MTNKKSLANNMPELSELLPPGYEELLGPSPVLPFEKMADFRRLHAGLILEYNPTTLIGHHLVRDIADNHWKWMTWSSLRRAIVELEFPATTLKLIEGDHAWALLPDLVDLESIADPEDRTYTEQQENGIDRRLRVCFRAAYRGDTEAQKIIAAMASEAGLTVTLLQADVYRTNIDLLTRIEEQIAKYEGRRNQSIRRYEDRQATLASMSKGLIPPSRNADEITG